MAEKFCLKWNDYQDNWTKALSELRNDKESADVTLISDDKVKFSAHKILLSSCSSMLRFILKENSHSIPLVYLGGVSSVNLQYLLDYIYHGEINISPRNFIRDLKRRKYVTLYRSGFCACVVHSYTRT